MTEVGLPVFTIGHSNRTFEAFAGLLVEADIALLADVRKFPMSRANPQFNGDSLKTALAEIGIAYEHLQALGGRRGKTQTLPAELNAGWTHASFHNYADYALSPAFQAALDRLLGQAARKRCAIMCSEAVWWRCHRRIIADDLLARGEDVFHIMGPGRIERARLTPNAFVRPDGTVVYPAPGARADVL